MGHSVQLEGAGPAKPKCSIIGWRELKLDAVDEERYVLWCRGGKAGLYVKPRYTERSTSVIVSREGSTERLKNSEEEALKQQHELWQCKTLNISIKRYCQYHSKTNSCCFQNVITQVCLF